MKLVTGIDPKALQLTAGSTEGARLSLPVGTDKEAEMILSYVMKADPFANDTLPAIAPYVTAEFFFGQDGLLRVTDGNTWSTLTEAGPFNLNQWHKIIMALDYRSQTWDLAIDEKWNPKVYQI